MFTLEYRNGTDGEYTEWYGLSDHESLEAAEAAMNTTPSGNGWKSQMRILDEGRVVNFNGRRTPKQ